MKNLLLLGTLLFATSALAQSEPPPPGYKLTGVHDFLTVAGGPNYFLFYSKKPGNLFRMKNCYSGEYYTGYARLRKGVDLHPVTTTIKACLRFETYAKNRKSKVKMERYLGIGQYK